jgi:type II secretory pathway predicted ATPase ExeA
MYEASFGLKRRPFAATPDPTCFLAAGPIQAALDEIVVCVEQGQGISVLTAPAGTGKTLLCERLNCELGDRFHVVILRHSTFLTRRSLLQTLLCELGHPYQLPSEHELRLELLPAIRQLRPDREALVVICDEAHHLSESLIEELRILADFADSGRPLVRLVLAGQLALEEKLTHPSLSAFNQRIRAQVDLPIFDHAGSLDYIDYRITWGGGRTDEIFTAAAMEIIARASDGVPRCINQLADHSLLLAFVAEQCPVPEETVLEALNDLRQLPLHWNESSLLRMSYRASQNSSDDQDPATEFTHQHETQGFESTVESHSSDYHGAESSAFEVGAFEPVQIQPSSARIESIEPVEPVETQEIRVDVRSDDWRNALNLFAKSPVESHADSMPSRDAIEIATGAGSRSALLSIEVGSPSERVSNSEHRDHQSRGTMETPVTISAKVDERFNSRQTQESARSNTPDFTEEVVLDRYASIDAGLPFIEISATDNSRTTEVRAVPSTTHVVTETFPESHDRQFDPADVDHSITTEPEDYVLESVRNLIDIVSERRRNRESQESAVEQPDSAPFVDRIDPSHPLTGPAGMQEPAGNSIVETLLRGPGIAVEAPDSNATHGDSEAAYDPEWEAVETETVERTEKPRPFRYLFSMLRRKQQQMK